MLTDSNSLIGKITQSNKFVVKLQYSKSHNAKSIKVSAKLYCCLTMPRSTFLYSTDIKVCWIVCNNYSWYKLQKYICILEC